MGTTKAMENDPWDATTPGVLPPWRQSVTHRLLGTAAARVPRKEAVRFEGRSVTYEELDALSSRAANGLLALGARPGDVVGLMAPNEPETLALMYGMNRAGLSILPLNPRNTTDEIAFQVADAGAQLVISPGGVATADVLAKGHDGPPDVAADENGYFHVRFSSGTTGRPKAIATTNRAIATMHSTVALELGYSQVDVGVVNAPLAHASFHLAAAHLSVGATILLQRQFDPETVWLECDRHGATHAFMVPTMFAMSLDKPGTGASLVGFLVMSAVFPLALKDKVRARFPHVGLYESYGATELGMCTLLRPEQLDQKGSTVGLPHFGYRLRVLDLDGRDCPPGEIGEIYVQGPSMASGYVGSVPPAPHQVRDGWVSVGDLGSLDEDGFLSIADRRSDLVISGGLNVYPAEVEEVLLRAPGVIEVAVIGVPDDTWGQVVTAVVSGHADAAALDELCRASLAAYKVPRRYEFRDELPKNPSGKILRRVLRDELASATADESAGVTT